MFIQIRNRFGHGHFTYNHKKIYIEVILVTVFCGNYDDILIIWREILELKLLVMTTL